MTFNELFSTIGENLGKTFHYLGNTPIEELWSTVLVLILAIVILVVGGWTFYICLYLIGSLIEKVFPNKKVGWIEKETPLEKQSMYKMGKKMKRFFSKKDKKKKK